MISRVAIKAVLSAMIASLILTLSACGSEGASQSQEPDVSLGAANPDTGDAQPPSSNTGQIAANQGNTEAESLASNSHIPEVSFGNTQFSPQQSSGDVVTLDGSSSSLKGGSITGYRWTQLDRGQTLVEQDQ